MIRALGLCAAALAGSCFAACSSSETATGKVMTIDPREAGSVAMDANENHDAVERDSRESELHVEPTTCESIPAADDVGCPDPDATFPWGVCAQAGQRCLLASSYAGVRLMARCEGDRYDATRPPGWVLDAFFYDAGTLTPQEHNRVLVAADCAARPLIPCACRAGETAENAIERNPAISRCQLTNPIVFVEFDDAGCPVRAQYGDTSRGTLDFESCLLEALGSVRFDCASSTTRVVLMTGNKE